MINYGKGLFLIMILLSLTNCNSDKQTTVDFTDAQKQQITAYSRKLINSINSYDFSVVNSTWNNELFKNRITNLTKTQQSVLDHIFEKQLKFQIKSGNLSIIHNVHDSNGKVSFVSLTHRNSYSELVLLLTFPDTYNFFKYRIELEKNKPALVDFYNFKDDLWYSEKIINSLKWNSKHDAYSAEIHEANAAIRLYKTAITREEKIDALRALNQIPDQDNLGNGLSTMKLHLAMDLGDTIFTGALLQEYEQKQNLYMQYLYYWFTDSTQLDNVYQSIEQNIGATSHFDTLWNSDRIWD